MLAEANRDWLAEQKGGFGRTKPSLAGLWRKIEESKKCPRIPQISADSETL